MVVLLVLGVLLFVFLLAMPLVYAVVNPVVNVADDLATTAPYAKVDAALVELLGNTRGYELQVRAPGTFSLSYRRAPMWSLVLGLLTFPLGILIVLFARETLTLTFSATPTGTGTRVLVLGRAHQKLALATGTAVQVRLERLRAAADSPLPPL